LAGELAAEGVDLAAAVIYYGGHPAIEKIPLIKCPIEGHYGVTDIGITDKVFGFAGAMHEAGKPFAYSVYNANHGFANVPGSLAYNAFAAEVAEARVQAFLARHLT
jgi:carboxymethylenebutenolidase